MNFLSSVPRPSMDGFNRIVLRRNEAGPSRDDDIESQPLSPRDDQQRTSPSLPGPPGPSAQEMAERNRPAHRFSSIRRPTVPSRFRFSSSTEATSAMPTPNPNATTRASRSNTFPTPRPSSSHYPDEDDEDIYGDDAGRGPERSPKTPPSRYSIIMSFPSTRLHLPGLQRTWTQGSNGPPTGRPRPSSSPRDVNDTNQTASAGTQPPVPIVTVTEPPPPPTMPPPIHTGRGVMSGAIPEEPSEADELYGSDSPSGRRRQRGAFHGADPAETHLAELANDGRRRRRGSNRHRRRHRRGERREGSSRHDGSERRRMRRHRTRLRDIEDGTEEDGRGGSRRPPPKHFLFCFPWIKSRRIRQQIVQCFVSGLFLVLLLTIYLALSVTKNINNNEFTVLIVLVILFATIYFCHGLVRLCMLIYRPRGRGGDDLRRGRGSLPQMYGPGGYAIPRRPIRVVLARDEEAAGIESETAKMNPPAYGLWRESVRVDPNRIYWQRNTEVPSPTREAPEEESSDSESASSDNGEGPSQHPDRRRPPSYASEDGVSYVVEARPRSTAPPPVEHEVIPSPLPVHPSEAGRSATPPRW